MFRSFLRENDEDQFFEKVTSIEIIESDRIRGDIEPLQITINHKEGRNLVSARTLVLKNAIIQDSNIRSGSSNYTFEEPITLELKSNVLTNVT